ncbi:MAG: carboxymuconolactone decarboxylase family protein [Acidobacteria bacterium]|nr:carboxymuconolactone decarboxylase family protein [Acidobacteriota bacterium]
MAHIRPIPRERAALVLRSLYDSLAKQLGATPKLFQTMAHRPELLLTFANVHRELWTGGAVDTGLKRLAALRTAALNRCRYARTLHAKAAASAGVSAEQVAALERDDWEASGLFDERARAVLRLAETVTAAGSLTEENFAQLRKWFGDAHLVELCLLVGAENLLNRFALCFQVEEE